MDEVPYYRDLRQKGVKSEVLVHSGINFNVYISCEGCIHCVKSVQIRSFFWSVFFCIRAEYGEILQTQIQYLRGHHANWLEISYNDPFAFENSESHSAVISINVFFLM